MQIPLSLSVTFKKKWSSKYRIPNIISSLAFSSWEMDLSAFSLTEN